MSNAKRLEALEEKVSKLIEALGRLVDIMAANAKKVRLADKSNLTCNLCGCIVWHKITRKEGSLLAQEIDGELYAPEKPFRIHYGYRCALCHREVFESDGKYRTLEDLNKRDEDYHR